MLTPETIEIRIRDHGEELRRFGVTRLELFGSFVRDEATSASDVDLLVELSPVTFDAYMDVKFFLEDLLGRRVDLVIRRSLKPALRDAVLREAKRVA